MDRQLRLIACPIILIEAVWCDAVETFDGWFLTQFRLNRGVSDSPGRRPSTSILIINRVSHAHRGLNPFRPVGLC